MEVTVGVKLPKNMTLSPLLLLKKTIDAANNICSLLKHFFCILTLLL